MTLRLALVGPPGSGKSTIAVAIADITWGYRLSFAYGVKEEIAKAISMLDGIGAGVLALKEMQDPATKDGWRALQQAWGTDFRRAQSDTYWLDKLEAKLENLAGATVVVDDTRFPNEYAMLKGRGFVFVRLLPGEQTREQTQEIAAHESERYWPEFETDWVLGYEPGPERQARTLLDLLRKSGH